ncbi:MAG: DUF3800 domain-containing protein [Dehalococcoidia bacterium]|nr:DUF3800 domain-containing protein [Dehalococcoidia bacterium]
MSSVVPLLNEDPEPADDADPAIIVNGPPPGVRRFAIYCDESGTGGSSYYGFGSLWMSWQRRGEFAKLWRTIQGGSRYGPSEMKWKRVRASNLDLYRAVVDLFFEHHWLAFHCLVVPKAWVDLDLHKDSLDVAHRKHMTQFLANKVAHCVRTHRGQATEFRVYADHPFAGSGYGKAHEAAEVIGNNLVGRVLGELRPIDRVLVCDSKERPGIQLCDVLLGAVMDAWNRGATQDAKPELRRHIASQLGWDDLDSDTMPGERKFNVWYMCDPREPRSVETRPIALARPLPPVRRYNGAHRRGDAT